MSKKVNISIKTDGGLHLEAAVEVKSYGDLDRLIVKPVEEALEELCLRITQCQNDSDQHTSGKAHQSPSEHQQGKHQSETRHD
jgi:hypothetical protein